MIFNATYGVQLAMTHEEFEKLVHEENEKSLKLLMAKGKEYSDGVDRLQNFKCASGAMNSNPADALAGMLVKHFVSILEMARSKDPLQFSESKWDEKLLDIRNYTYLLKGVLIDMGMRAKRTEPALPTDDFRKQVSRYA